MKTSHIKDILIKAAIENGFEIDYNYTGTSVKIKKCLGFIGNIQNLGKFFASVINKIMDLSKGLGAYKHIIDSTDLVLIIFNEHVFKTMRIEDIKDINNTMEPTIKAIYFPNLYIDKQPNNKQVVNRS